MSEGKVARVYADALFRAAEEEGRIEAVRRDLRSFVEACRGSRELRDAFSNQDVAGETRKRLVMELTEGATLWSATSCAFSLTRGERRYSRTWVMPSVKWLRLRRMW